MQEPPGELTVTANSRMSASILLSKLFDDLKGDAERENFHRLCENYIRSAARPVSRCESSRPGDRRQGPERCHGPPLVSEGPPRGPSSPRSSL